MTSTNREQIAELLDSAEREIRNARAEFDQAKNASDMSEALRHAQCAHNDAEDLVGLIEEVHRSWGGVA